MKISVKPATLKYLVLGAGALGILLRFLLYATGTDDEGLLLRGHFTHYLMWILNIAVLAGLFLMSRTINGPELYRDCFPVSTPAGVGCILAALGILVTTIQEFSTADIPLLLCSLMGFAAALALMVMGAGRLFGFEPSFLFPAVLSVYFTFRMVSQYRFWSADPQLQDYVYHMFAYVGMMLAAYHHAAFGTKLGNHRNLWFYSLATVYLCCLTLAGPQKRLLYLTVGIWLFTNLTNLTARSRRRRPALNLEEE